MGRRRKSGSTLPPSYFPSHGAVFHVANGKWRRVGTAADAHAEYAERLRDAGHKGMCDPLIDAAFDAMKARIGADKLADNTIDQYEIAARKLKKILQNFEPRQVMPKHAAAIKLAHIKIPNMCNRLLSFGRAVFGYGLEHQLVDLNPFVGIKRYKEAKRTRLIQWDEWWKIRAVAPRRLQLVMDGLYLTDRRIEDLLKVDERDALEDGVYFDTSKTDKELIIAWNEDLRRWWADCLALHGNVVKVDFVAKDKPRPLFKTRHGRRPAYKTVYDQWVKACERAEVEDCNLHDNRAFSATELKNQKGGGEEGERAAQRALGHKDRKTTRIYLRDREVEVVHGPTMPAKKILGA